MSMDVPSVPVVLRFIDGRMEKCFVSPYFSHSLRVIQVIREDRSVITQPVEALKAVFFVRDLDGCDHPQDHWKEEGPESPRAGRAAVVTFSDGEKMRGRVLGDFAQGAGFFLYPMEPDSNNEKVFVVRASTAGVEIEG
jgi:hypothetical protein